MDARLDYFLRQMSLFPGKDFRSGPMHLSMRVTERFRSTVKASARDLGIRCRRKLQRSLGVPGRRQAECVYTRQLGESIKHETRARNQDFPRGWPLSGLLPNIGTFVTRIAAVVAPP